MTDKLAEPGWLFPHKRAFLQLHAESIVEFGGRHGVADETALNAALDAPHALLRRNPDADAATMAADFAAAILKARPFCDGNRRAALLATGLFLAINGWRLAAPQGETVDRLTQLANGATDEAAFAEWLRRHLGANVYMGGAAA